MIKALGAILIMTVLIGCGNRQWDVSDIDINRIVVTEMNGHCNVHVSSKSVPANRWHFPIVESYEIDSDKIIISVIDADLGNDVGCCLGEKAIAQVLIPKDAFGNGRLLYIKDGNKVHGAFGVLYVSDEKCIY